MLEVALTALRLYFIASVVATTIYIVLGLLHNRNRPERTWNDYPER